MRRFFPPLFLLGICLLLPSASFAQCDSSSKISAMSPVCINAASTAVTVFASKAGIVYQAYLDTLAIGAPTTSTGGNLILSVPIPSLQLGDNVIHCREVGCPMSKNPKKDSSVIRVNALPVDPSYILGDTICDNSPEATLFLGGVNVGEKYSFSLKNIFLASITPTLPGNARVTIPRNSLHYGLNTLALTLSTEGCGDRYFVGDSIHILVNPQADINLQATVQAVCGDSTDAEIIIDPAYKNVSYQLLFYDSLSVPDAGVVVDHQPIQFSVPARKLVPGLNKAYVKATLFSPACPGLTLQQEVDIYKYPVPVLLWHAVGDTVSEDEGFAKLRIICTEPGLVFAVYENDSLLGTTTMTTGNDTTVFILPVGDTPKGLKEGMHNLLIKIPIQGCKEVTYTQMVSLWVKSRILTFLDDPHVISKIKIWPNPTFSTLHIQANQFSGSFRLTILNTVGATVYEQLLPNGDDLQIQPNLPSGVYQLNLEGEDWKERKKLVIQ
jgi:hypothetical protein